MGFLVYWGLVRKIEQGLGDRLNVEVIVILLVLDLKLMLPYLAVEGCLVQSGQLRGSPYLAYFTIPCLA
jgi:hypothetical protein